MPPFEDSSERPSATESVSDRLDSWKEIAAFLQRDVRTVQRWEKQAGLPVYRHAQSRLRTAYAYRSELDAWWRAQRATLHASAELPQADASSRADANVHEIADSDTLGSGDHDAEPVPHPPVSRRAPALRAAAVGGGLVVAVLAITFGGRLLDRPAESAAAPATSPVVVLLTRFEDQAADPALIGVVEEAVQRRLGRQAGLQPVTTSRVQRVLRLMRRDASTPLTAAIAREVAIRDGGIAFVLSGRLHRLQSQYFLDLEAVEPSDGHARVSLEGHAGSREEILAAVDGQADRLASAIAQAAAAPGPPPEALERVTTASLPALRLYTAAVQAGGRRQWSASELLARRAIVIDPDFAAAHAWAGWAMRQQGQPARACLPFLERAVALASHGTDRENYLMSGALHTVADDLPSALAAYEALLRLQPGDRGARDLLIDAYLRAGRVRDAGELAVSRAGDESDDFYANVRAGHALMIWRGDRSRALPFIKRAEQLAARDAHAAVAPWGAWLSGLPVFNQWMKGDARGAVDTLARLDGQLATRLGRERDAYATMLGFSYLAVGRIREAERAFRQAASPTRQVDLALLALSLGDEAGARRWLLRIRAQSPARPALFARAGLVEDARRGLESAFPTEHAAGMAAATRGLIAMQTGHSGQAVESLTRAADLLRFSGEPEYFLTIESLARIWTSRGATDRAANLLSDGIEQRARTYGPVQWTGGYWIKLNADLAALYHRLGRDEEARRLDDARQTLLAEADADHPLRQPVVATASIR